MWHGYRARRRYAMRAGELLSGRIRSAVSMRSFAVLIRYWPPAIVRSSATAMSLVRSKLRRSAGCVASPDVKRRQVGEMSSVNKPGGNYLPVIIHGGIAYVSGQLPRRGEDLLYSGKVGAGVDIEAAQEAAALCADLCISAINHATGGEDRIVQVLQLVGYIASAPGFTQQSQVMNGASDRLIERLGDRGRHARTSVGVAELPRGAPVELNMMAAVRS
jgi:enamine deaminase RidA (YjgF/YER057c/UK114 family)